MALLNQPTQVWAQVGSLFEKLRAGRAPEKFNREFLRDIGFKSSNHHAFIPLLKGLGFLTSDGAPNDRYREFLDGTKWRAVLAHAIKEAYGDIFVIKTRPTKDDLALITGKYKSTYNLSESSAERAARTFLALVELADSDVLYNTAEPAKTKVEIIKDENDEKPKKKPSTGPAEFHYNIQIHLPATKEVEVYSAIFKSLREHIID